MMTAHRLRNFFLSFFKFPVIYLPTTLGGPVLKYLPSAPFFPIFGPTAVPKILVRTPPLLVRPWSARVA